MPFRSDAYGGNFTEESINRSAPKENGVYGLFRDTYIFIGYGPIYKNLKSLLKKRDSCLKQHWPNWWIGEITSEPENRAQQLIKEYNPPCNKEMKR